MEIIAVLIQIIKKAKYEFYNTWVNGVPLLEHKVDLQHLITIPTRWEWGEINYPGQTNSVRPEGSQWRPSVARKKGVRQKWVKDNVGSANDQMVVICVFTRPDLLQGEEVNSIKESVAMTNC